jgi:xeroderma pigmentosum group C-complementing protein
MMYVLAVEDDGYMRDVTPRYAKQYSSKISKVQSGGRGRREWWAQVVRTVTRPYKLVRESCPMFYLNLMVAVAEASG